MFDLSLLVSQKLALAMVVVILIAVWDFLWKAVGLWKSARNNQTVWFVLMLLFSTAGILPIIYIYFFQRRAKKK